jgi:hypothetical protein
MKNYKIPLKLVKLDNRSFHLLAEARIDDTDLNLVIDTGASRTVFDRKLLEARLNGPEEIIPEIQSAGIMAEKIECRTAVAGRFIMGDLILYRFPVIMIDLDAINRIYHKVTGHTIHGLLGSDFLHEYQAEINYRKLILKLKN